MRAEAVPPALASTPGYATMVTRGNMIIRYVAKLSTLRS